MEAKILHLEQEIAIRTQPISDAVTRLCTIPGVSHITAWGLIAEIGVDMNQFPSAQHLASWAGLWVQVSMKALEKHPHPEGQRLAATMPVPICLVCLQKEKLPAFRRYTAASQHGAAGKEPWSA